MPIRTNYKIFAATKQAPIFQTYDRVLAYVNWNDFIRHPQGDMYRLEQIPEPLGALTKSEEYLMLVYRVRKLIRQYYARGRRKEDLLISLDHEKRLDDWNKRTQAFMDSHPGYKPADEKSHAFFLLVSQWRKIWHERMSYRKLKMRDERVLDEMSKKCRDYESQIDKIIKDKFGLL